jgi:hypothetical protein
MLATVKTGQQEGARFFVIKLFTLVHSCATHG